MEGIADLASCSHYGKPLLVLETTKSESTNVAARPPGVRLPEADALPSSAAQALLRSRLCNVIALVGPHESGKTSLIGGIYDLLQESKVGNHAFAGSVTLHAFERACHDARTTSKREAPHMERTDRGPATYFHLDLADLHRNIKQTALFANRDGEAYMDTQANPDLAADYPELRRCDTLTVLADGVKLLDNSERHQVLNDVCLTLRAFVEAEQTRPWQQLAIVLTKIDAVRKAEDKANCDRAIAHFERIVSDVRAEFVEAFADIRSFHVSASPKGEVGERGEGMELLLSYWMVEPRRLLHPAYLHQAEASFRAFGRLRPRTPGDAHA